MCWNSLTNFNLIGPSREDLDHTSSVQSSVEAVQIRNRVYCQPSSIGTGSLRINFLATIPSVFEATFITNSNMISLQEAYKRSNNWLPPPWAIVAMIILGFNEFMLLLR